MSATTKIAIAVASGYVLGRTKKMKLALSVTSLLAGQRLTSGSGGSLLRQGTKLLGSSPELKGLQDEFGGRLKTAARDAALGVASSRMEKLTRSLQGAPKDAEDAEDAEGEEGEEPEPDERKDGAQSRDKARRPAKKTAAKRAATPRKAAPKKSSEKPAAKKSASRSRA